MLFISSRTFGQTALHRKTKKYNIFLLNGFKGILIFLTVMSNNTLAWKILQRKQLHTIFNLGMCFFFFLCGSIFPMVINEYGSLLSKMIQQPEVASPYNCHRLLLYRVLAVQSVKVFILNIICRYPSPTGLFTSNYSTF